MLSGLVVVSVVVALVLVGRGRAVAAARPAPAAGRLAPGLALAVVTGAIYVNQLLFTVYVLRVHGGDPSFVARHLPDGWFDLADVDLLESAADRFPAPRLLAASVLRVQAFLEPPFVVFAYLTVCRWCSAAVYGRALRLVWAVAASYTATFCLIEWRFHNPYTADDIVLRIAAAVVVSLLVPRLAPASSSSSSGDARNPQGLLAFALAAGGLGLAVLVVYDTALLYNLGRVDTNVPLALAAGLMVAGGRLLANRVSGSVPGPGIDLVASTLGWLLVLGFVPALAVRYGLGFGARPVAVAGALVVLGMSVLYGFREARPAGWAVQVLVSGGVGLAAAATSLAVPARHPEARMLWAATTFFVVAVSICTAIDRRMLLRAAD